VYPILLLLIVLLIYGIAYVFHGKKILEQKIVKADGSKPTPAWEKFDVLTTFQQTNMSSMDTTLHQ